ncbi:MAG: hypothetical protein RL701_1253 [Pseudomonadota bacterium]
MPLGGLGRPGVAQLSPLAEATDLEVQVKEPLLSKNLFGILSAYTLFAFSYSLFLIIPIFYTAVLHTPATSLGQIKAVNGLAAAVMIPVVGRGIDKWGRLNTFRAGIVLLIAVGLGYLRVDRAGALPMLLSGLTGAAFVLTFNAGVTLAADAAPAGRLTEVLGVVGAVVTTMNAGGAVTAEALSSLYGWHAVFWLSVCASVLAGIASFFASAPSSTKSPALQRSEANADPRLSLAGVYCGIALAGIGFAAIFIFHQAYAVSLGLHSVRTFFIGFTLTAVLARVLLSKFIDRWGRVRVAFWACWGYALTAALLSSGELRPLSLFGALFGVAHGALYPALNALVVEAVPASRRGRAIALYNGVFNAGVSIGALAWGLLADRAGYQVVFLSASGCSVLGAIAVSRTRQLERTLKARAEQHGASVSFAPSEEPVAL